jgi:hypothetical protein
MKRAFTVVVAIVVCLFPRTQANGRFSLFTAPFHSAQAQGAPRDPHAGYAGDDACRSCHADQLASYHQTAHCLTSMEPGHDSILGKFMPGDNILKTANPNLYFRMDEQHGEGKLEGKEDSFLQTAVAGTPPHTNSRSERIAFVIGSGDKGQTYLYWSEDQLFQLPVSYWTRLGWVNSPNYRDGFADFDRPIIPRCLECHATYFEALPPSREQVQRCGLLAEYPVRKVPRTRARTYRTGEIETITSIRRSNPESGAVLAWSPNGSLRVVSRGSWPAFASLIFPSPRRAAGCIFPSSSA